MNFQQPETGQIDNILTKLLESLDLNPANNPNALKPLNQLSQNPRIIINGNPFGSKSQFQSIWSNLPLSNHQITSLDSHSIPSTNNYLILAHLKVRFDESGKNKLGDSTLLTDNNNSNNSNNSNINHRPIWSHWFGVSLTCIIDSNFLNDGNSEFIHTWDYRFTEKPDSSIYKLI